MRAARARGGLVLGLFALNLGMSLLATWPFYATFEESTRMRPFAEPLAHGLDLNVLSEILSRRPDIVTAGRAGVVGGTIVWLIVSCFLMAGILASLRDPLEMTTLRRFGAEALGGGFAMMRLQVWILLGYALAGIILVAGAALGEIATGKAVNPWWHFVGGLIGALPGIFALLAATTVADVARARAVLDEDRTMAIHYGWALGRMRQNPGVTMGVALGGGAIWLTAGALYVVIAWPFGFRGVLGFAVLTLLRQALVIARTGIRVGTLGAMLEVTRRLPTPARARILTMPMPPTAPSAPTGPGGSLSN